MRRACALFSGAALSEQQKAFVEQFRQKLAADEAHSDLDTFVETAPDTTPVTSPFAASVGKIDRGAEPLPSWLKLKIPKGVTPYGRYATIRKSMREKGLSTVCEEAKCPNIGECWGGGDDETATATIMLMGSECTRGCRFCSVKTSRVPQPLDPEEPNKVASAVKQMGVDYIVVTMVDRDDLPDGGCNHVVQCIRGIKESGTLLECLVGDFRGNLEHTAMIAQSGLDVYAHNVECVERVTPNVRDRRAGYRQSLNILEHAKKCVPTLHTKSSIMLGLGEEEHEIRQTLRDLRTAGVSFVTLGQYLQPSKTRMKVSRYAHPSEFDMWASEAKAMGFLYAASGPMVRSSYRAGEFFIRSVLRGEKGGKDEA